MIAFKIVDIERGIEEYVDINPNTAVSIQISNPLFDFDQTAGTITYPINLPLTKKNQQLFGFPEILSNQTSTKKEYYCQAYILNVLWKIGVITYRGFTGKEYVVNFQADAGEFQSRIKDSLLRSLDLGNEAFSAGVKANYPASNYSLFPIHNTDYNTDSAYNGYMNYYDAGFIYTNSPKIPFPYLPYILTKTIENFGYSLTGNFLNDADTLKTVIYNTFSVDTLISFANHVPDMKVGEFLQAVRSFYGLAYLIDATTKTIRIVKLKDVLSDLTYLDWTSKADQLYSDQPVENSGYTLIQQIENQDELNKTLSTSWAEMKIAEGKETIETRASTLHMVREADTVKPSRSWLLPATAQSKENKFSFRLLKYYGLQKDSLNIDYPLGSAITYDYAHNLLPGGSMVWANAEGLYEQNYKAYLDFLSEARPIDRTIRLNIADLITLDPTKKIMIEGVKSFFSKISLTVTAKDGIGKAKVELLKTKL